VKARLLRLYVALERRFGPQQGRPSRSPFAAAVGAILAEQAAGMAGILAALRARGWLTTVTLAAAPPAELALTLRAAGARGVTARRLRPVARWLLERFGARFTRMRRDPLVALRREMCGAPGLGPEVTDAILLHAADRPVFVADALVRRVLVRHRVLPVGIAYEPARTFLETHLPSDPGLFKAYHALIVAVARTHCRTVPRCRDCPLRADLGGRVPAA
jgi:endonuclease III related protein